MKRNLQFTLWAVLFVLFAKAQLTGYSFMQPITASNPSSSLALNYQLKLTVNTQSLIAASQMMATGDDIRFGKDCGGNTLYNYWIESGMNTATTTIWVKIDSIAAGANRTFFMFYGNNLATPASAVPGVFVGPNSSTDSVNTGGAGGVGNSQRGFRFTSNEDVLVTAFGKNEPTGTTRYVTLFDYNTQAILAQTQVGGPAAQYSYSNLATPMWLTQGTQYILQLFQGASDGYYFGNSSAIGQAFTYIEMRYCNSCTQNTYPTNVLTNYHYGYPDLWYWTKTTLNPAPTYTIGQGPTMSVTQSSTSICPGNTMSLTASISMGSPSFTWQPGNLNGSAVSVSPSSTTIYTITASSPSCAVSYTNTSSVTVNPNPALTISGNNLICGTGSNTLTASGASTYSWNTTATTNSISVSPTVTTSYTVTGTSSLGCSADMVTTVTVNAIPSVSVSSSAASICTGGSVTLNASGASTYSWSTSGSGASISVTPTASTTYSVDGYSASGCQGSASIAVTVNSLPPVSAASSTSLLCPGQSATLTASGANTYSWNTSSTNASIVVSPTVNTTYTVTGTNTVTGCMASFTITQNTSLCTSISSVSGTDSRLILYPNPNKGQFVVEADIDGEIAVTNTLGQKVHTMKHENGRSEINLSALPAGIYFLNFTNNGKANTLKFVKE